MRRTFLAVVVIMLFASLSIAAPSSHDPRTPAEIGAGIRYQLSDVLGTSSKIHTIFFVLSDQEGKTVVTERFIGRVPKGMPTPTFAILRDADARAEVSARAASLIVTVDGQLVESISLKELVRRGSDLMAMDASRSPFVSARPKGIATSSPAVPAAGSMASRKLTPHQQDTWNGCDDDEYCTAQWNYCNENCAPWDPYNPCEACNSNYTECTGGDELSDWTDDTIISSTPGLSVCGDPSQIYAQFKTYTQYSNYTHHQEFQYFRCLEEDGYHYTTVTVSDTYYIAYCYHLIDGTSCNSSLRYYITCLN